jgi:hypothetical protein
MLTSPGSNERLYCTGGAAHFWIRSPPAWALKDQQKRGSVYHTCWESPRANPGRVTLPRPLSLSDFGIYFVRWRASAARPIRTNKATANQSPVLKLRRGRVLFQRTATRQQWIVQRLHNDAVNDTVELRLLTVFQHVVDPTRVCTVADKNSAVTQLELRPTAAD